MIHDNSSNHLSHGHHITCMLLGKKNVKHFLSMVVIFICKKNRIAPIIK